MCVCVCVCDLCVHGYTSMIRCNGSRQLIFIDEGVLPTAVIDLKTLSCFQALFLHAIIRAGAQDYSGPVITTVISSSKQ